MSVSQFNLIQQIFHAVQDSDADPEAVYSLLEANLDQLDASFVQSLWSWAKIHQLGVDEAFILIDLGDLIQDFPLGSKKINTEIAITSYEAALTAIGEMNYPEEWAFVKFNLGNAYRNRTQGVRSDNLEHALACFQAALKIFSYEDAPEEWAMVQNNLAITYSDRVKGNKSDNLEAAIRCYEHTLQVYTRDALPQDWAETQNNLANIYADRIQGNRADNLEQAIDYYHQALQFFTYETFPADWALNQNNLGLVYIERLKGNRAENIEKAIAYFQSSLLIRTREHFPDAWALAHNNLAMAFRHRIQGDRVKNLEQAIECYRKALQVYRLDDFPEAWSLIQNNLAIVYSIRVQDDKADNLEQSIHHYQKALQIRTYEAFPTDWATIQMNLGESYRNRIRGEQAENLEQAIECYQAAMRVCTRQAFPRDWAEIQTNLANAYSERIRGNKADNLERAIECYQHAQQIHRREALIQTWATTQNSLATAYYNRINGHKENNLEKAIGYLEDTLQAMTREAFPQSWAMAQSNLATIYSERIKGEQTENLERAIQGYQMALQVRTRDALPIDWAITQFNLAAAHTKRSQGKKINNLNLAIHGYQEALRVFTREAFPRDYAEAQFNLGLVYFILADQIPKHWSDAYQAFADAIDTVEFLRNEILVGSGVEQDKKKLAEAWNSLYQYMIETCLMIAGQEPDYYQRAIEYVERSKARNLVELLGNKTLYPHARFYEKSEDYQCTCDKLTQLRGKIATNQRKFEILIRNHKSEDEYRDEIKSLQNELCDLRQRQNQLFEEISHLDASFKVSQNVHPILFSEIKDLLDEQTVIVEWYITEAQIFAFIITSCTPHPTVWQSTVQDYQDFMGWAAQFLKTYRENKDAWRVALGEQLRRLGQRLHLDKVLELIPMSCDQLILIPHRILHLLPLHALPLPAQPQKCLLDRFKRGIRYAPSCQLLQLAQTRQRPDFTNLFAIQNPTDDLTYTDIEVAAIQQYFDAAEVFSGTTATKAVVSDYSLENVHCAHFSCHGSFNLESPLKSSLKLADKPLTLDEIFSLKLQKTRLVTLSACETGLTDPSSISDEYIGLPSGFLYSGSPNVVSSLWSVDDVSTALLMIKFYENLQVQPSVAMALNQSQCWLRDASRNELKKWIREKQLSPPPTIALTLRRQLSKEHPFQALYHWAAFCMIG